MFYLQNLPFISDDQHFKFRLFYFTHHMLLSNWLPFQLWEFVSFAVLVFSFIGLEFNCYLVPTPGGEVESFFQI